MDEVPGGLTPFEEHVLTDLHTLLQQVGEMHRELDELRPLLAVAKAFQNGDDVQRGGIARMARKAARGAR